jgi:uncharacterized damage-inducible protein DinB
MTAPRPEVWLRGPVAGVPAALQPVAHALLQAEEEILRILPELDADALRARPGGAAAAGWHLRHLAGSLDRLLTYARGEPLDEAQRAALAEEQAPDAPMPDAAALGDLARRTVARALAQLRATDPATLDDERRVGRAGHPSTVRGLLSHAAEHTARHVGQLATTAKIVRAATASAAGPDAVA